MNIYDKECKGNDEGCGLSKLNNINNTYDF
jgi:hypothetical protein